MSSLFFLILPVFIEKPTRSSLQVQELWLVFTETFCCGFNKCLYDEAGAAALIDTFLIVAGDVTPCRGKIAPKLGETVSILLDNSFIELLVSNLKIWEKQELI